MNQLNECMYCGSLKDQDLTDEHIIPFGMGGDLIFRKSSCKDCARKTSQDEMKVLRGFMYDGRLVGNLPSRRKKKQPTTVNNILLRNDGTEFTKELLLKNGVAVIHLPIFTEPGVIFDKAEKEGVELKAIATLHLGFDNLAKIHKENNVNGVKFNTKVDVISFAKVLCKIAYGYHVNQKGLFPREESPALKIMQGKITTMQHWIGSRDAVYPDASGMHILNMEEILLKSGVTMHIVYITLFRGMGANSEYAVITRVSREQLRGLDS